MESEPQYVFYCADWAAANCYELALALETLPWLARSNQSALVPLLHLINASTFQPIQLSSLLSILWADKRH